MKPVRLRVLLLVVILAAVGLAVALATLTTLYRSTLELQQDRLVDLVAARESLTDAVYRASRDDEVTLDLLAEAQREAPALGETGEFTIARREGDEIAFLTPLRHAVGGDPSRVSGAGRAEPMVRALAGLSGTMIGRDYRGERVLAAYRPVDGPGWGLVAKMDLAEIRAPIVRAGGLALLSTLLFVSLGTFAFLRVTTPMTRRLEESEEELKTYFDESLTAMAFTSPTKGWLRANPALCELLGSSFDELAATTWAELTHPDDLAADVAQFERLLAGEIEGYRLEKRFVRSDGGVVPTLLAVKAVRNPDRSVRYVLAQLQDITERVETEAALAASEQRYRRMFGSAPVSIWDEDWSDVITIVRRLADQGVGDLRTYLEQHPEVVQEALRAVRIRDVNAATLTMFEASDKEDLLGSLETVFATPDTLPGFVGELVALAQGREVYATEMALRTVTGRLIHTLLTMSFPPAGSDSGEVLVSLMDISDRKRAEGELADSRAMLQTVVDSVPQRIFWKDLDSRYLGCNAPCAADLGLACPADIVGTSDHDLPWREVAEAYRADDRAVMESGEAKLAFEEPMTDEQGRRLWVRTSKVPLRRHDGEVYGVLGTYEDVTAAKTAEERLRASEERLRRVVMDAPFPIMVHAEDGEVLMVSRVWSEISGYRPEQIPTIADWTSRAYGERRETVRAVIDELHASQRRSHEGEFRITTSSGEERVWDFSSAPLGTLPDGRRAVVSMANDVTEREQARRELEAEKNFSEAMLASLPGVCYLFDETLRFHRWNRNFETVTGYSAAEVDELTPLQLFGGPDQARVAERIGEVFATGESSVEAGFLAKDGTTTPYLFTGRMAAIGDRSFLVGMGIDISARVTAERELAELNAELEQRIAARTRELELTVEQVAAANRELESFSYTVSHDLRAPLRAIDGFSRILLDEHGAQLEDEARRYLQIVRDNTRQMGLLIDDLLAFSRLSRQELRTQPVDLGALAKEAWTELAPDRDGRRVELVVGELPTISGDPRLLKLVFVNLLGNALKFTRPRELARIEVGRSRADGADVCFVRDNGVGFDARYSDKLFGVFQRLHRADQFEGTGVGLATVARILHRHGGRVWADGALDQGATFYLSFDGGDRGSDQPS